MMVSLAGASGKQSELAPGWNRIEPGGQTICGHGDPFAFFARPGTANKLLIYFPGGDVRVSYEDCRAAPGVVPMSPGVGDSGIFNRENVENPFLDYYTVIVPPCTGDMFLGSRTRTYVREDGHAEIAYHHKGSINAKAVLDWVYENFGRPEIVFATGCSAGASGSFLCAPYLMRHYEHSRVVWLGDAGFPLPPPHVTKLWGLKESLPGWMPEVASLTEDDIWGVDLLQVFASYYPEQAFAVHMTEHDATIIEVIKRLRGDREDTYETGVDELLSTLHAKVRNFHSYLSCGYGHTILDTDALYVQETGGIRLVEWVDDLVNGREVPNVKRTA